jgi:hypothetical protein
MVFLSVKTLGRILGLKFCSRYFIRQNNKKLSKGDTLRIPSIKILSMQDIKLAQKRWVFRSSRQDRSSVYNDRTPNFDWNYITMCSNKIFIRNFQTISKIKMIRKTNVCRISALIRFLTNFNEPTERFKVERFESDCGSL